MSAIPWIGQDVVQFLWGGLNSDEPYDSNVILKILLIAGTSLFLVFVYFLIFLNYEVKMSNTKGKSAEVNIKNKLNILASQRLHAENLIYPYLVGIFEGDGWFSVSKKGRYVMYELGIELHIRDVQLLYKIKTWLGVGQIGFIKSRNLSSDKAYYRIRNKSHLRQIILPIFDKYPMLSNKQYDYLRFRTELLSDNIFSENLKSYVRPTETLNSIEFILNPINQGAK